MQLQFFLGILIIILFYIIGGYGFSRIFSFNSIQINSLVISGILASFNVISAFLMIFISRGKDFNNFVRVFFSGIAARIFILLVIIFTIIKLMNVDRFVFIFSFFILYFVFQIWELIIINKHLKQE